MIKINIPMLVEPLVLNSLVSLARREGRSAGDMARILITRGLLADLKRQVEDDELAAADGQVAGLFARVERYHGNVQDRTLHEDFHAAIRGMCALREPLRSRALSYLSFTLAEVGPCEADPNG